MRHRLQFSHLHTNAGTLSMRVSVSFKSESKKKKIENKINVNFLLWPNVKPRANINCQLQIPDKSAALSSPSSRCLLSLLHGFFVFFGVLFKINLYCLILLKADFFLPRLALPWLAELTDNFRWQTNCVCVALPLLSWFTSRHASVAKKTKAQR